MVKPSIRFIAIAGIVLLGAIARGGDASENEAQCSPSWAADAIWYQVFVGRFCNGSPDNDPAHVAPWEEDWAHLLPGESGTLRVRLLERCYGGDLQGLRSKFAYLKRLGVNTLYLSPIFRGTSEHKYDTIDHRHIDDGFAVLSDGRMARPETVDPNSWQWTKSDRLFLEVLEEAHEAGFRVVVDGVFNHVGRECWAFKDVLEKGQESQYRDWFAIDDFGPPVVYTGWDRPNGDMPEFNRAGGEYPAAVVEYLLNVVTRWMDPNGDGDPRDGVDGWRLDAAEKVPSSFWRAFRKTVKRINPEAIIVGEIWTEAHAWLGGDQFDSVTSYMFSNTVMGYVAQSGRKRKATELADELIGLGAGHSECVGLGMVNLLGSHDTERAVSMIVDPLNHLEGPSGRIPRRDVLRPDDDAFRRLRLGALLQFSLPGCPIIYYGDEVGMFGGRDPYCRGPMWWNREGVSARREGLLEYYRSLCKLRRSTEELRRGDFRIILADDARRLMSFSRRNSGGEVVVVVNFDEKSHEVSLSMGSGVRVKRWLFGVEGEGSDGLKDEGGRISVQCAPLSGVVGRLAR